MRYFEQMAEEKGAAADIASGVRSIFERVGEFFHIFDLSFFVAGASTFGAGAFLYIMMRKPREFPFEAWVGVFAVIVACYICGLIAFAVGREISGAFFRKKTLHATLPVSLDAHRLCEERMAPYLGGDKPRYWWLYMRMWSEVAHDRSAPVVLHHLMRYWAMAATYDGVAFSLLVWAAVFVAVQFESVAPYPLGHGVGLTAVVAFVLAAFYAFRRGAVYFQYQIEDVVAHFAVLRGSLLDDRSRTGA
jgi:hypothetical protein